MKTKTALACAVVVLSLILGSVRQQTFAQTTTSESEGLNTVVLNLTAAQLDPLEGNSVVRAFVPTGSKNQNCLTSLGEIRSNSWPAGTTVFCGEREPSAFGGVPGLLVSVFFTQPATSDLAVSVTLYQKGARKYGTPVLCAANDGC